MKKLTGLGLLLTAVIAIGAFSVHAAKAETEQTIEEGIYIGNVNVGGMTEQQARSAVDEYVAGLMDISFTLQGDTGSIQMTAEDMGVSADAETAVQNALAVGHSGSLINRYKSMQDLKKEKMVLDMYLSVNKQATAQKLYESADQLAVGAEDNTLKRVDGKFEFVPGKEGVEVDIVNSVYAINEFLASGWDGSHNEIALVTKVVEPRGTREELAEVQDLLGAFSTNFASSSAGRAKNVTTGCSKVNGTILYPGEEFELCKTVSPFTQENGYELAGMYQNGTTVESFGGGICQVATTLYNAVIRAELEITMRYNHSMEVHYAQPSMDAAIAGNYKDMRFKNNTDTPIYIEGYCNGGIIYFNIFGKETRPSNREISFESEVLSTKDPKVEFTTDASLALGTVSVTQKGDVARTAQLWKVVKVGGEVESREIFNKSSYQGQVRMITIGTRGASSDSLQALRAAIASGNEATVRAAAAAMKSKDEENADKEDDDKKDDDKKDDNKKDDKNDKKDDKNDKKDDKKDNDKKDDKNDKNDKKDDNKKDDNKPSGGNGDSGNDSE